jgi:8-hydroxy-5-deazaflavin:NADPH oxidoreductase
MKIAILGGTGKMGEGFACRWAPNHEIYIGSRDIEKAREAAKGYVQKLANYGVKCNIDGMSNMSAAEKADVIVLAIPYSAAIDLVECLQSILRNQTIISIVVPMTKVMRRLEYTPPTEGCGASHIRSIIKSSTVKMVSAYHNVSYNKLSNLDLCIECDIMICSDDIDAKKTVIGLTREIPSLRPLDGGSLCESCNVESLTPFLINVANRNGLSDLSVKLV